MMISKSAIGRPPWAPPRVRWDLSKGKHTERYASQVSYLVGPCQETAGRQLTIATCLRTDDVTVGIFDVKVLRAPCGQRERFENGRARHDALFVERLDGIDSCGRVEV